VRPVPVVVPGILGQDLAEMLLAEDQHMIQALAAKRARERRALLGSARVDQARLSPGPAEVVAVRERHHADGDCRGHGASPSSPELTPQRSGTDRRTGRILCRVRVWRDQRACGVK
jgi:hypothetical protein